MNARRASALPRPRSTVDLRAGVPAPTRPAAPAQRSDCGCYCRLPCTTHWDGCWNASGESRLSCVAEVEDLLFPARLVRN